MHPRLARMLFTVVVCAVSLGSPAGASQTEPAPAAPAAPVSPAASAQAGVAWQDFAPPAFRRALAEDRLVLLVLEAPWNADSNLARAAVWDAPEVIEVIRAGYVPIRERSDLRPDLVRRYPAEGWPAVSVLLPDGSPLFLPPRGEEKEPQRVTSGFRASADMAALLRAAFTYYRQAPRDAVTLAQERTDAIAKSAVPTTAAVTEPLVFSLARELRTTFDPERRYFGGAPRLPRFELLEFMFLAGTENDEFRVVGSAALDTLSARLADPADGGMRRAAEGLDWENPQPEKLLDRNARYLELTALALRDSGSKIHRDRVAKVADFIMGKLSRTDGFFAAALAEGYGPDQDQALSGANGLAAAALIRAGAVLGDGKIVARGLEAATVLREKRYRQGRLVPRAVVAGVAYPAVLEDQVAVAWAFLAAYEFTGRDEWLAAARDLAQTVLSNLRGAGTAALQDMIAQPNAPRPLRAPIYPLGPNAEMVRVLVRLFYLTDQRTFSHAARDILAAFGGSYTRNPLFIPHFALACYEYFLPPITVAVSAPQDDRTATQLRAAAMGAAFPFVIVRTFTDRDTALKSGVPFGIKSLLSAFHGGERSELVGDANAVPGLLALLRETAVAKRAAREADPAAPKPAPGTTPKPPPDAAPKKGDSGRGRNAP